MRYLCLIYTDERALETMSGTEGDQIIQEYVALRDRLERNGQYLGSNRLQPTSTATIVRVRRGELSTTDGPFAETKEQLGGYFLVEAANLDEAIELAAQIPGARYGSVEVRPVADVPGT